jgi:hypothetical protein
MSLNRRSLLGCLAAFLLPAPASTGEPESRPDIDPDELRLCRHPALRAAAVALRQAHAAALALVDATGPDWEYDCLAMEADLLADVAGRFAGALASEVVGRLPRPARPQPRTEGEALAGLAVAVYGAVDACCELVAWHGCAGDCYCCDTADFAAGYLLGQGELFCSEIAQTDPIQLPSCRRRAALRGSAFLPHSGEAVRRAVRDLEQAEQWQRELAAARKAVRP